MSLHVSLEEENVTLYYSGVRREAPRRVRAGEEASHQRCHQVQYSTVQYSTVQSGTVVQDMRIINTSDGGKALGNGMISPGHWEQLCNIVHCNKQRPASIVYSLRPVFWAVHEGTKGTDSVKGPEQLRQSQCPLLHSPPKIYFSTFLPFFGCESRNVRSSVS